MYEKTLRKNNYLFHRKTVLWQAEPVSFARSGEEIIIEVNAMNCKIPHTSVAKYMKNIGLSRKLIKKFKVTTDYNSNYLAL